MSERCRDDSSTLLASSLTLWPNPARSELLVQAPAGSVSTKLRLYDCAGKLVRQFSLDGGAARVSVRGLAPGIYVARLGSLSRKFTIAR